MPAVSVVATGSGTTIVAANYNRLGIVISNSSSTANCHLTFGTTDPTTNDAYIPPGGNIALSDIRMKHQINGISSSGTITIKYSEIAQ